MNIVVIACGFILFRITYKKYEYTIRTHPPLFSSNYKTIRNECLKNAIRNMSTLL